MSKKRIDLLSSELEESGVEEIDLTEKAMYKRAFKKFYYQSKNGNLNEDEDNENDCDDLTDEDIEVDFADEDLEVSEEDVNDTEG